MARRSRAAAAKGAFGRRPAMAKFVGISIPTNFGLS